MQQVIAAAIAVAAAAAVAANAKLHQHCAVTIAAVIVLAVAFGHIYMGTAAMEGAFEAMATGYCDENWAKEHHDIWYKSIKTTESSGTAEEVMRGSEETN